MKSIALVELGDGNSILVEVEETDAHDTVDIGLAEVVSKAQVTFADSIDKLLPMTRILMNKLRTIGGTPDEIEVAFGFNISLEAGAIIASSNVGANFGVVLKWSRSAATKEE